MSIPLDAVIHKGTPLSPAMDWATLRTLLNLAMEKDCHHLVWQPHCDIKNGWCYSPQRITLNELIRRALPVIENYDHLLKKADDAERKAEAWKRVAMEHKDTIASLRGTLEAARRVINGSDE